MLYQCYHIIVVANLIIINISYCAENKMKIDIVQKGKDCLALIEKLYSDFTKGCTDVETAEQSFQRLAKDGEELAKHSEQKASAIEKMEEQKLQEVEEIQRQISELGKQEEETKRRQSERQSTLNSRQTVLDDERRTLSNAESDLRNAEERVYRAKKDAESRRAGGGFLGALLGTLIAPGVGTLIGAAVGAGAVAGTGAGEIWNQIIDDEKKARRRVGECRDRCSSAERDVRSTQTDISNIQSELYRISCECSCLNSQHMQYIEKAMKMKESVLFYDQASKFWKEFQQLSEHGVDRTAHMNRIITKAKEKKNISFLTNDPSKHIAMTFLEAWEEMEVNTISNEWEQLQDLGKAKVLAIK